MEKHIIKVFEQKGIKVDKLIDNNKSINSGLLHGPIHRYIAYTDIGVLQIVVKSESIVEPPELLFKDMYMDCAGKKSYQSVINFEKYSTYLSMCNMPQREHFLYTQAPKSLQKFLPKVWNCVVYGENQFIIMEDLSSCINIDKIDCPDAWGKGYLLQTMRDLAKIHYELQVLRNNPLNLVDFSTIKSYLLEFHNISTYGCGIKVNEKVYRFGNLFIKNIEKIEGFLLQDATVIHNDFNIRNICISKNKENIKVYDWEFFEVGCPMFDIVDFLISISPKYINIKMINEMIETYISTYSKVSGKNLNKEHCL